MKRKVTLISTVLVLAIASVLVLSATASAQTPNLQGPVYPAPGGNDFAQSGDAGRADGITYEFSNFDFTQFAELYWGPAKDDQVVKLGLQDGPELLTFDSGASTLDAGEAVWTGSDILCIAYPPYEQELNTQFTFAAAQELTDGSVPGISETGAVLHVTGDFSANLLFEVETNSTPGFVDDWYPAYDLFDAVQNCAGNQIHTEYWPGFFYQPYVVIDGCNTYVPDVIYNGVSCQEAIDAAADDAKNHGKFVSAVSKLTNEWKKSDLITGEQKGTIVSCAAQSDLP